MEVGGDIFPIVRADTVGDHFAIEFPTPPACLTLNRQPPPHTADRHRCEGQWVLQRLSVGPELGEFPLDDKMEGGKVRMKVKRSGVLPSSFDFSVKVCNTINVQCVSSSDPTLESFEGLSCGRAMATMMMGTPEQMEVEAEISNGFSVVRKWIAENGVLILNGPTVEMEFVEDAIATANIEPIHLMHAL
jgi:hypothetical protein